MKTVPSALENINLGDLDFFVQGSPHDAWRVLRERDPVHWNRPTRRFRPRLNMEVEVAGFWNVTKYSDIFRISKDPETFISSKGIALGPGRDRATEALDIQGRMLIMSDPPRHTKLRRLVNKGFTPRTVAKLEPRIRAIADEIISDVAGRGECDFVVDVSAKLPLAVICELMGVPREDWPLMFDMTNRTIGSADPEYQIDGDPVQSMNAFGYFARLVEARRTEPLEDLVTTLIGSQIDGEKLDDFDILLFCFLLIVAGNETTRNATTGGMLALLERPEELERLRSDRGLMASAIEEILRWSSPVMHMTRTATRDVELRGRQIKAGDKLAMWYASANRDEDVFDDAYRFDVARAPNEHLAFGVGEHFCLGANLARLELQVMFEELLERLPGMRLAGPPERLRSNFIGGIKHLPVLLGSPM
jgi:cytochrome P450